MKTIAIVGNPNSGKTTLFNQLTGSQQKVGNWAGVTVSKKTGRLHFQDQDFEIVDLPGVYSLSAATDDAALDEKIASEYIFKREADLYVNIIDANNLKRNLYLTLQLIEMQVPVIVVLNMMDLALKNKLSINIKKLEKALGCKVLPMICNQKRGLENLKQAFTERLLPTKALPLNLPRAVLDKIANLKQEILKLNQFDEDNLDGLVLKILEQDGLAKKLLKNPELIKKSQLFLQEIKTQTGEETDILIADSRYGKITEIFQDCVMQKSHPTKTISAYVDKLVMHRILGLPIFLLVMYLMFEFSMNVGTLLQPLFAQGSMALLVNGMGLLAENFGLPSWLTAILTNGVGLGINTILTFTPQIAALFLFLSWLEDSGYMARAAFVMDRLMQSVGLPGKSFIPLIVGFGCNVPAIMATRTLESRRDRILTAMMSPFMSCGARLAIFVVFASAFFPKHGGFIVFLLYLMGMGIALFTGLILKSTVLRGEGAAFVLELPSYHLPHAKTIFLLTWQRLKGFVWRAGKLILPICVIVGSLNAIQIDGSMAANGSKDSLLSYVGRAVTPVLKPIGIQENNWPATVGLITGTLAKEVVVGTLNTLYTQGQTQTNQKINAHDISAQLKFAVTSTITGFKKIFSMRMINPFTANEAQHEMTTSAFGQMQIAFGTTAAAFAYLVFVLLYIPCVSTMGVLAREIGKNWSYFAVFWSFSIAYSVAVLIYQLLTWREHVEYATTWIGAIMVWNFILFLTLRFYANKTPKPIAGIS